MKDFYRYLNSKLVWFLFFLLCETLLYLFVTLTGIDMIIFYTSFITFILVYTLIMLTNFINLYTTKKRYQMLIDEIDQIQLLIEIEGNVRSYEGYLVNDIISQVTRTLYNVSRQSELKLEAQKEYFDLWAHEIKIPIQNIQIITDNYDVNKESKKIEFLVNKALFLSKMEAVNKSFHVKEELISPIVEEAIVTFRHQLIDKNIVIENKLEQEKFKTDAYWFKFCISQLIDNSIKYEAKKIKIHFDNGLIIEDDGMGILETDLNYIYDRSFVGKNAKKVKKATGMGLYLVYNILASINFTISCESKVNEYTRFKIYYKK